MDDYTSFKIEKMIDGTIKINKKEYTSIFDGFITIMPDGRISETGDLVFVEVMKEHDVRVICNE